MSEWWPEEKERLVKAIESVAHNLRRDKQESNPALEGIFVGTLYGASKFITDVLNDPSLNTIAKHTELRNLAVRLERTAQRVEEDRQNSLGKLPHSFDV